MFASFVFLSSLTPLRVPALSSQLIGPTGQGCVSSGRALEKRKKGLRGLTVVFASSGNEREIHD
jgi:hypothetical protein